MIRRVLVTALTCLGLAVTGSLPAPAQAAGTDQLGLSRDGALWVDQLTDPLFSEDLVWVPGDTAQRRFWVRNQTTDPASLTITALTEDADRLLADGHLQLSARVGHGTWHWFAPGNATVPVAALGAGRTAPVRIRAAFDQGSGNISQDDLLALDFVLRLTQDTTEPTDPPTDPTSPTETSGPSQGTTTPTHLPNDGTSPTVGPQSDLPETGSPVEPWLIALAALLCGAGIALIAGFRRSTRTEESSR